MGNLSGRGLLPDWGAVVSGVILDPKKIRKIVGKNTRLFRMALGLTQVDLSKKSGIARGTIALIETGAKTPSLTTIGKISQALKIEPHRLLVGNRIEVNEDL